MSNDSLVEQVCRKEMNRLKREIIRGNHPEIEYQEPNCLRINRGKKTIGEYQFPTREESEKARGILNTLNKSYQWKYEHEIKKDPAIVLNEGIGILLGIPVIVTASGFAQNPDLEHFLLMCGSVACIFGYQRINKEIKYYFLKLGR